MTLLRVGNLVINLDQVRTMQYHQEYAWSEWREQPRRPFLEFEYQADGEEAVHYLRLRGAEATAAWREICDLAETEGVVAILPDDSLPASNSLLTEGTQS